MSAAQDSDAPHYRAALAAGSLPLPAIPAAALTPHLAEVARLYAAGARTGPLGRWPR